MLMYILQVQAACLSIPIVVMSLGLVCNLLRYTHTSARLSRIDTAQASLGLCFLSYLPMTNGRQRIGRTFNRRLQWSIPRLVL